MRKRRQSVDESFDMFLDTITNTFGGVLLIALLIVLMIRESNQSAPQSANASSGIDLLLVQAEIETLQAEKTMLAASVKTHQDFEADFQHAELKALAQTYSQKMALKMELEQQVDQMSSRSKRLDHDRRGIETREETLKQQLVQLENQLKKLNDEVTKETQIRVRSIPLPKEEVSRKSEVPILISANDLYIIEAVGRVSTGSVNQTYFVNCKANEADLFLEGKYWKARAGSGIPNDSSKVKSELGKFDSNRFHLTFIVRSNSFATFSQVRDQIVNAGFEYRLILTDDLVSRGGAGAVKTQ